jgi:PAS domain S-box-containing protein
MSNKPFSGGPPGPALGTADPARVQFALERAIERAEVAQQAAGASLYEYRPRSGEVFRNPSLQAVTGHAAEEIGPGKDGWRALLHPEDVDVFDRHLGAALRTSDGFSMEYRVRHKAGHWIWIADRGRLVRGEDGQVRRIVGMVSDVTRQRLAAEALHAGEQRFRATFDNAAVGIAHVGLDGRWLMVNDRLCAIVGRARQALLDHGFREITHAEDLDADLAFVRRMLAGEIGTYTLDGGRVRPVRAGRARRGPVPGRSGHRAGAGAAPGADARRPRARREPRARPGRHLHGVAAAGLNLPIPE